MNINVGVRRRVYRNRFRSFVYAKDSGGKNRIDTKFYRFLVNLLVRETPGVEKKFYALAKGIQVKGNTEKETIELEQQVINAILRVLAWEQGSGDLIVTAVAYQPILPVVDEVISPVSVTTSK